MSTINNRGRGRPPIAERAMTEAERTRLSRMRRQSEWNHHMTTHELKSWPEFFEPIIAGIKTFELRKNDRNYQVGDVLVLREWKPTEIHDNLSKDEYTGRVVRRHISYMLKGLGVGPMQGVIKPYWGLDRGYCILGLMQTAMEDAPK